MDSIVSIFTELPNANTKEDCDFVDRLNSRYSVIVLVVFTITVGMHQYVGTPITCFEPTHFEDAHVKYTNSYCWVKNTYYLPLGDNIPPIEERKATVMYYQWVPFILLGQAVLFYLPSVLWHSLNCVSGVDADNILHGANSFSNVDCPLVRKSNLVCISNQLHRFLSSRRGLGSGSIRDKMKRRECCGRRFGAYLCVLYIITKALYVLVGIGQLYLLSSVLGIDYSDYGIRVVRWMATDTDWTSSPSVAFPLVSMCDFGVRRLGAVHQYTVQCTLPINLYNEKVFTFLWFWIVGVTTLSVGSMLLWIARAVSVTDKINYIVSHLEHMKRLQTNEDRENARIFTRKYLRADGIFLLRLIGHNTNTLTVSEIICALWDLWKKPDTENVPEAIPFVDGTSVNADTLPKKRTYPVLPEA